MPKLIPGLYPVTENCTLIAEQYSSYVNSTSVECPSHVEIRAAILSRYRVAVTLSKWTRAAGGAWTATITSELTAPR